MRNVVITGCNRGLGGGIRDVFLKDSNVYGLNRTATTNVENDNYHEVFANVGNYENVSNAVNKLPEQIDLLVLNAGIRRFNQIRYLSVDDWNMSVETNLNGVFYTAKALLPRVIASHGDIVIIGSHSEKYTFEKGAAYCSTKGGLKEFAEVLMQEVRYDDVRVSYLSLGSIKNREHGGDEDWKLMPNDVGETVYQLVSLPKKVLVPYLDVRPIKPLKSEIESIDRLQYV